MRSAYQARAIVFVLASSLAAATASAQQPQPSPAAQTPAPSPAEPLGLDRAIAMALVKNDDIIVERQSLASAKAALDGTRGTYDPVLDVTGDWQRSLLPVNSPFSGAPAGEDSPTNRTAGAQASVSQYLPSGGSVTFSMAASRTTTDGLFTLLSPAYATQAGVEIRQPLLRDRATDPARTAIRVASSDRRRAEASLRREVSDTTAAVEQAYWTLVAARRAVEVREEAVSLASDQLEETRVRVEKGASPETEIAQPRAEQERRRGELFAAKEAASRAESALKNLILGDGDDAWAESLVPTDSPDTKVVPVDVAAAMDTALASRPELDEAKAVHDQRLAQTALARDSVRPALDAVASYDTFGLAGSPNPAGSSISGLSTTIPSGMQGSWGQSFGMLDDNRFHDARVGLEFRLPIGNRAARANAAIAHSAAQQAEAALSRARKAVRVEVLDAAAALETAGQRIEAARSAREAAEVQLSAERDRFEAGLSTNFLVLTRQNDLSSARLDEIAALTDYRKASAEMARATGTLIEDRGIEIDAAPPAQDSK